MKIRCLQNTGEALRHYEYDILKQEIMGRFGATAFSRYGGIEIGKEYIVMGVVVFKTYQAYLIDDDGFISACPCQLFEVVDNKISSNWYFRLIEKDEDIYPFIQAVFGYYEWCFDRKSYENIIIEKDKKSQRIYFTRKLEFEHEYTR